MIKIEKNVEMPNSRHNEKYPFGKMEVGDSFVTTEKYVRAAAQIFGKINGKKFITRTQEDKSIRVWRAE